MTIIHYQPEHINTLANSIYDSLQPHKKYTSTFFDEKLFHEDFKKMELDTYSAYFERIDNEFANSEYRIRNYNIKQKRSRVNVNDRCNNIYT